MHMVRADDHLEDVVETERGVHVVATAGGNKGVLATPVPPAGPSGADSLIRGNDVDEQSPEVSMAIRDLHL